MAERHRRANACFIGVDDDQGRIEVTDCFGLPAPPPLMEGEDETQQSAVEQQEAEYTHEMMRLLRDANGDDNCVGWYRSVNMGDWCNADFVEEQFEQQEDLDTAGIARSVLIMYDPYQTNNGRLAIKAVRLTDAFVEIMRARASADARVATASDVALSHFLNSDVFYEIPIVFACSPLQQALLHDVRPALGLDSIHFEDLVISGDPNLEKNVAFMVEELDRLQREKTMASIHQRNLASQKQQQTKFIAERKAENLARAARGEDPLPLKDLALDIFKPMRDSSKLSSLLIRKQVGIYCEQVFSFSADSFQLNFVRSAVQPSPLQAPSMQ